MSNTELDLTDPSIYRFWSTEHVRFADLDILGHVNNKAYATYYESARIEYMASRVPPEAARDWLALVRLEIDYLKEIHYPGTLRLGVSPVRLGNSSITMACAIFNSDVCCSTSIAILVCFDQAARKSRPFPDELRKRLEADL
jgi:acyl-CoA thioester hydrolase